MDIKRGPLDRFVEQEPLLKLLPCNKIFIQ